MRRVHGIALPARLLSGLAGVLLTSLAAPAPAQVIAELDVYDNTTTLEGPLTDIDEEVGDEIELIPPASGSWTVTEFEVGYVGFFPEDGDEEMVVRFYANDGPGGEPGTLLYQSAPEPIVSPESFSAPESVVLTGLSVVVPLDFTWTVETMGLSNTPGDIASVSSYGPPTVGSSDETQYWRYESGGWFSSTLLTDKSNFYARVRALPEPGVLASAVAGALLLAALRRRRAASILAQR
jgi:hypothetical protein